MVSSDPFAEMVLAHESDPQMQDVWLWLEANEQRYPAETKIEPLRPLRRTPRQREIIAIQIVCDSETDPLDPQPLALLIADKDGERTVLLPNDRDGAQAIAEHLLIARYRGKLLACWQGAKYLLHLLLRHYARPLTQLGYTIGIASVGSSIRFLTLRKNRHIWRLCDVALMIGFQPSSIGELATTLAPGTIGNLSETQQLQATLTQYQREIVSLYGVDLSVTIGTTAIKALQRHLSDDLWLWRPLPLTVTLCRDCHGFRGGYVWSRKYTGEAWQIDMTRAYTSALLKPQPARMALGPCVWEGKERDGIYICRLRGHGIVPAYLPIWCGADRGFIVWHINDDNVITVLPSAEFEGLRALGYTVEPGWGMVQIEDWNAASYVTLLSDALAAYGTDHPLGMSAKLLGNAIYGKLAECPGRIEIIYSADDPGTDWLAYLTVDGEEVEDLWIRYKMVHRAHQHIDTAATITAHIRSQVYIAIANLHSHGIGIIAAGTDTILCDADPSKAIDLVSDRIGSWRLVRHDRKAWVRHAYQYVLDGAVRFAGVNNPTPEIIEAMVTGETVTVAQKTIRSPFVGERMYRERKLRLH